MTKRSGSGYDAVGGPAGTTRAQRKQLGAWYTPAALAAHVVSIATSGVPRTGRIVVVDAACGDGRFLAAARDLLGPRAALIGVDVDPNTVAAARENLPGATIVCGDALDMDWSGVSADIVVGNPPYLNQLETATARPGRSRYGGGPYCDIAADFLALSATITKPGGRIGLVLPQSLLTTRDTAAIRTYVSDRAGLVHAWWSNERVFDANVYTCALVAEVGARQGAVARSYGMSFEPRPPVDISRTWGAVVADVQNDVLVEHGRHEAAGSTDGGEVGPCLGDIATISVDFRDQYYGLVGAVGDNRDGPPLVTSGLIDPGVCRWGERPVRFAKASFTAPRVDLGLLSPALQRWATQRLVPKVLVANQTRTIESVVDRDGSWLPSVPVITCVGDDLDLIQRVLSAPASTAWVRTWAAGSGLSPAVVRLTPSLLASIPVRVG